ncbi:MAG: hypothetical protein ACO3EP_04215 [Phycisphaerales bacterium]
MVIRRRPTVRLPTIDRGGEHLERTIREDEVDPRPTDGGVAALEAVEGAEPLVAAGGEV